MSILRFNQFKKRVLEKRNHENIVNDLEVSQHVNSFEEYEIDRDSIVDNEYQDQNNRYVDDEARKLGSIRLETQMNSKPR